MLSHFNTVKDQLNKHKILVMAVLSSVILLILAVAVVCYQITEPYKKYIVDSSKTAPTDIGLVLGAGVAPNGKPYEELKARLDSAADALNSGLVNKLILSGDNRVQNYDEPTAMIKYLVNEWNIPEDKLQRDFAGRSTYESCERASKVFNVKKLIIFSANSHLPRAIYLCRHFGIESYGVSSGVEANNSTRRELLARIKAVYNANLIGEPTVLGDTIELN